MSGTIVAGPRVAAPGERSFTGAALDSRKVARGALFFALGGSHTDGHRFVPQALAAGAAAAVVRAAAEIPPLPEDAILIRVEDTTRALHALTRAVRATVPRHLVGLTGSAGKTTTKELLAAMLARRYKVAKSPGNLNNTLGFPLALLGIPDDTEWMVAEMGMSTPGELAEVSVLARPDVAILLNVRPAHLENFGSLAAIAEAKAEILAGLAEEGLLVANADDPEVVRVAGRHRGRILWFGYGPGAEVRASAPRPLAEGRTGSTFELSAGGATRTLELALHGLYNADNCLAAAATAHALGVSLDDIALAAATITPAAGRGVLSALAGGGLLIDDSYNSNPVALIKALESAAARGAGRRFAILGDMLELGPEAPRFHAECGAAAARLGFSPVVGVGPLAHRLVEAAGEAGAEVAWYASAEEAAGAVPSLLCPGDTVLVKGSRGVALDRVVAALLAATAPAGGQG